MPCFIVKPRPMTRGESFRIAGYDDIAAAKLGRLDETVAGSAPGDGPLFMCGERLIIELCRCGHEAGFLCDYPIGNGQTCDVPMCPDCRRNIGIEVDLCEIHLWEFKRKSGRSRLPDSRATHGKGGAGR